MYISFIFGIRALFIQRHCSSRAFRAEILAQTNHNDILVTKSITVFTGAHPFADKKTQRISGSNPVFIVQGPLFMKLFKATLKMISREYFLNPISSQFYLLIVFMT